MNSDEERRLKFRWDLWWEDPRLAKSIENAERNRAEHNRAFANAIAAGRLSEEPNASNFAGAYMFMGHNDDGKASFKHIDTRRYLA